MLRVVIADDEELMREGLKSMLERHGDIEVVGFAQNGREAFELCEMLSPDLVLMDLSMPLCDGIEGTRLIKQKYAIKVLVLTVLCDKEKVSAVMKNGADGYALKDIGGEELARMVKGIAEGLHIIHRDVLFGMEHQWENAAVHNNELIKQHVYKKLTQREKSITQLIVQGKSNKEIAVALDISEGRVRNVVTSILKKMNQEDRTQLAIFAIKNGIV